MSMSKKDYIAIAAIIKGEHVRAPGYHDADEAYKASVEECARGIAGYCAADNPRFDRARFLAACGVQS